MKHALPVERLGPAGPAMAEAVQACVHCGFCLPTCPTYGELGQEMDTPRGRIMLMKEALEERLPLDEAMPYVDKCLGCLACETSCPSGVEYRNLLGPFRERAESRRKRGLVERWRRRLLLATLPEPGRFRVALALGLLARRFGRLMPSKVRAMLDLLPEALPARKPLPPVTSPEGKPRARVAMLAGCAQQVIEPEINHDVLAVLSRNGVEVIIPEEQTCCGALGWHVGAGDHARKLARANLKAFPRDVDAVLTNAAGCGSGLLEYPLVLKGEPEEEEAKRFAGMVMDWTVFLDGLGFEEPPEVKGALRVAYQDACHLRHAQGVTEPPRRLLRAVPGVELVEPTEPDLCCGSAGSYNLDQPEVAEGLGRRKIRDLLGTRAEWVVSGNIGCLMQLRSCMRKEVNEGPKVMHLGGFMRRAYEGELSPAGMD